MNGWANDWYAPGSVPSGTASGYTIIRAQNRFGARLVQTSANYYGAIIMLAGARYVWVDGFVMEKATSATSYAVDLGQDNRLTRSIVVQKDCDAYGGAVAYGDRDTPRFSWRTGTFCLKPRPGCCARSA